MPLFEQYSLGKRHWALCLCKVIRLREYLRQMPMVTSQPREKRMRLCRHALAIILGSVLLLPLGAWAQENSRKQGQQPASKPADSQADQQAKPQAGENAGAAAASEDESAA